VLPRILERPFRDWGKEVALPPAARLSLRRTPASSLRPGRGFVETGLSSVDGDEIFTAVRPGPFDPGALGAGLGRIAAERVKDPGGPAVAGLPGSGG
jgi:hypothetical protein